MPCHNPGHNRQFRCDYEDMLALVQDIFDTIPDSALPEMLLHFRQHQSGGARHNAASPSQQRYAELNSGQWCQYTELQLREMHSACTILPLVLYLDSTRLGNNRKQSAKPLSVAPGMLPLYMMDTDGCRRVVMYMPTLVGTEKCGKTAAFRAFKNVLYHGALYDALAPAREAQQRGGVIMSLCGVLFKFMPYVVLVVNDNPEGNLLSNVKGSAKTALPCRICKVRKENLSGVVRSSFWRWGSSSGSASAGACDGGDINDGVEDHAALQTRGASIIHAELAAHGRLRRGSAAANMRKELKALSLHEAGNRFTRAMSDAALHIICGKPHIACGDRILDAASAFDMRRPHTVCSNRIWYAVPAYDMRLPHPICGRRIWYAGAAFNMRSLHMIYGCRIQYAVAEYGMRVPHPICGSRI